MPLPAAIVLPQAIVPPPQAEAAQLDAKTPVAPKPSATAAIRSAAADASIEKTAAIAPLKAVPIEPVAAMDTTAAASESTSKVTDQAASSVTITGCLASDDDTFVLKDTAGTDAPKARSWRSGFLKKRSATIELLDSTKALRLPSYVGQRVEATGMLANHEMRAQSLRRVGASCS
jgi:hypothetical protein